MKALVTGGTGFVGANLVHRLVADGHEVHLLVRPSSNRWRLHDVESSLTLHEGSVGDFDSLNSAVASSRPDHLFHLAAYGAYPAQKDPRVMTATNVLGVANLLMAARANGISRLVIAGSSSEYGFRDRAPRETDAPIPNSSYAATKAAATWLTQVAGTEFGVNAVVLRLYSVYGPWEQPGRLLPELLKNALAGTWPPLAQPELAHDFVYVDDVVEAFLVAASREYAHPAIFNIGTGIESTLRELVEVTAAVLDVKAEPRWGTFASRPWDSRSWVADPSRAAAELGWRPRHSLADGVGRMATWLRDHLALYAAPAAPL